MSVTSVRSATEFTRTVFARDDMRPMRLWTSCLWNGVTLSVSTTLKCQDRVWGQTWVFAHRRRRNPLDSWFRSLLGRPIPIRTTDASITPKRVELRFPWPWNSRLVFLHPTESVYTSIREFLGYHEITLHHLEKERTIDAIVLGILDRHTVRVIFWPGVGLANGGIPCEVPVGLIPMELRMPNTRLSVTVQNGDIVRIAPAQSS
jgi:hypothetical protein